MVIHEFFLMCNTIFSIVTQPPVNYTSLRSVLQNGIGMNVTLNSIQMAYVINKVNFFRNTFFVVKFKTDFIKTKKKKSEKYITDSIEILKITLNNVIKNIEELEENLRMFKEENINQGVSYTPVASEKTEEGTWWIRCLFDTYLKYGGTRGVTSIEFFNSIKDNWEKLEDDETIDISYITDNILGGYSIEHISTNLLIWLRTNKDIIDLKYRFIIKLMG
jgi:hypothetical protein